MSIKYFANRVKETSITTGNGNMVLAGPSTGFKSFINGIGANNTLTYYIYRQDTNFEWEVGVGYVFDSGGVNILVREQAISSSNNNNFVSFTSGTKFVETVISEDRINTSLLNVVEKSGDFTPVYMPATYVVDASVSGVQVSLPAVAAENNPIILGFVLNKTISNQYNQPNAILLVPSGTETIAGTGSYDIAIRNDYLQIMSLPSQSGWVLLDPVQDSSDAYGDNGAIQVKYDSAFSGVNKFNWDFTNSALLIGGTGTITSASVIIPSSSGSTVVFNEQSYANDLRVEGTGNTHLLFVDGSENKIAINSSNANDSLSINAQYGDGITVYRSGVGPKITINNTTPSGAATNDIIGYIVFSGLSDSGNSVEYGKIYTKIEEVYDGSESSSINMQIMKNGSSEPVAVLGASGISIGFNNSNVDGIVIGEISQNEGANVVLGYYQNICGSNCVAIGSNGSLASGTFGGLIGTNHSSSGNNIWIIGGSGVSISGDNKTYLAIDNNNHLYVDRSGNLVHTTFSSGNQNLILQNSYAIGTGINQYINFVFDNSSGTAKTGLVFGSTILDPINLSEDTKLVASILSSGSGIKVVDVGANNIVIGNSSVSGNNIVFAINTAVSGLTNSVFGSGISASGNNNILIGSNIVHSGNNTTILGKDVTCSTSGNIGITIFGNNNIADEDYVSLFGHSNSASGLHAIGIGYLNGVHGEYSIGVGESNLVQIDGSVAIGNNNNLSGLAVDATAFVLGVGNTVQITNTGLSVGYSNEVYGSGGFAIGEDIYASGSNLIVIGNSSSVTGINDIVIGHGIGFSGNNTLLLAHSGSVHISGTSNSTIYNAILSATNNSLYVTNTGIYLNTLNLAKISAGSGNSINVTPSGTSIYGSGSLSLGYNNSTNNIVVNSTGVTISGILNANNNGNNLFVTATGTFLRNGNSYVQVNSSGIDLVSTGIDILSSNLINITNTGVVSTGILLQSSGITIRSNSNNSVRVDESQATISSTGIASVSNNNNNVSVYTTGIGISSTGDINYTLDATGINHFFNVKEDIYGYSYQKLIIRETGVTINTIDTFSSVFPLATLGPNNIRFYNAQDFAWVNSEVLILQSGTLQCEGPARFGGYGIPAYQVDISGDLRVNVTGVGIVYENYPTATGHSIPLVIEDNVIRSSSGNSIYITPPSSTGCGIPLVIEDNIIKASDSYPGCGVSGWTAGGSSASLYASDARINLIDPNTSVLTLTLETANMVNGREFFIRNTSPTPTGEQIDIVDGYSFSTICTLGGTGISGSGDLSCHVVFNSPQWYVVSIGK
jgi:hypothetical protein